MRAALGGHVALLASAVCLLASPAASAAGQPVFYELPPHTHAYSLTAGPGGAIWFTGRQLSQQGEGSSVVGSVSEDGRVEVFHVPSLLYIGAIAAGRDGNLWFAGSFYNERGYLVPRIVRFTPGAGFDEFTPANRVGGVNSVTAGPDGAIWFTLAYWVEGRPRAAVGRIDATEEITRFPLPGRSGPGAIVTGPDGNLWFTERGNGAPKIGRITPAGRFAHFRLADRGRRPTSIVAGSDGNLWFGEEPVTYSRKLKNWMGRITTAGAITEFRVPGRLHTRALAAEPGGNVWFTTPLSEGPLGIGSIASSGTATPPSCLQPTPCEVDADALAIGADGQLWFSMSEYYCHCGGGGSALLENLTEESEAGFVGRFPPG